MRNLNRYSCHIISSLMFFLFLACSNNIRQNNGVKMPAIFPPPPDTTRIQYLTRFSNSIDITGNRSSIMSYILGEEDSKPINKPYGLAIHKGKIYICDTMLPGLEIIDLQKNSFSYFNPSGLGQLKKPLNCALDDESRLYIADAQRKQIIVFDKAGKYLFAIGDGSSEKPTDVIVYQGKIWTTDLYGHQIKVYDKNTSELLFTFPQIQKGHPSYLFSPTNLDIFDGEIYVTDTGDACIKVFSDVGDFLRKIGGFGKHPGQFVRPKGVAVDRQGRLFVVDAAFENVQIFNKNSNILMHFGGKYDGPGYMWLPAGISIDYDHLTYFQDFVYPGFKLNYLIFVANQYGPDRVSVYGFVKPVIK